MGFDDFVTYYGDMLRGCPEWRTGQTAYNALAVIRRDLADALPDHLDPFHNDALCMDFFEWVRESW